MEKVANESEKAKKALIVISKICYVIAFILMILCFVAAGFSLIGIAVAPFMPYDWIKDFVLAHPNSYHDTAFLAYINVKYAEVACVYGLLGAGVSGVSMLFARNLFGSIKEANTPFAEKAVSSLNMIGLLALIQAIAVPVVLSIVTAATGTGDTFNSWNFGNVFFALFIFAISLVFKYGVSLQKQADTTL